MHEHSRANGPKEHYTKVRCAVKNLRLQIFRAALETRSVCEMREPCAVKVACVVLRGAGGRKVTCLPDLPFFANIVRRKQC